MKRLILLLCTALLISLNTGCLHNYARQGGQGQGQGCGCGAGGLLGGKLQHAHNELHGWRHSAPETGPPGPPTGTYGYPYYSLHGPRDFLVDNPPGLGN